MEYTSKSSTVHQKQEVTTSTEYTKSTNIADGSIQDTLTIYVNTSQVRQLPIYSWQLAACEIIFCKIIQKLKCTF